MSGILSPDINENPLSYNWNKVFIPYCDGASFSGNVKDYKLYKDDHTSSKVTFKTRSLYI